LSRARRAAPRRVPPGADGAARLGARRAPPLGQPRAHRARRATRARAGGPAPAARLVVDVLLVEVGVRGRPLPFPYFAGRAQVGEAGGGGGIAARVRITATLSQYHGRQPGSSAS